VVGTSTSAPEPAGTSAAPHTRPRNPTIELLDLNPNTLQMTTTRLADRGITATAYTGSVLAPLPPDIWVFNSVSANFVLHCVPSTWAEKGRAFGHIAQVLDDDGVFFGSTILDVSTTYRTD